MDRIRELLDRLADLTADELAELQDVIRDEAAGIPVEDPSDEQVSLLAELAEAAEQTAAESTRRDGAASRAGDAADARARIERATSTDTDAADNDADPSAADPADDGDGGGEASDDGADADPADDGDGGGEASDDGADADPAEERAAAAAVDPRRVNRAHARRRRDPTPTASPRRRLALVAAAGQNRFAPGTPLDDTQLGEILATGLTRGHRSPGKWRYARAEAGYPPDRILGRDPYRNTELLDAVVSLDAVRARMDEFARDPEALVAAGGVCAPTQPRYDIVGFGTAARPVASALPSFMADRGSIAFIPPPALTDLDDAVGVWTHETDQEPGDTEKACATIDCPDPEEVFIDAITQCLRSGNFQRRSFPEQFRRWWEEARRAHARLAEGRLLELIADGSTNVDGDAPVLGAARHLIEQHIRAAAQYRSRHRLDDDFVLQLLLPAWVRDMIRADLILAAAEPVDRRTITNQQISAAYRLAGIAVTWYLDTEPGAGQVYGAQAAGALLGWEQTVVGYMFAPGTWIHLTQGTLDLGTEIRDSALNRTNDVEAFLETFESAARVGNESLRLESDLCVTGAASQFVTVACDVAS